MLYQISHAEITEEQKVHQVEISLITLQVL